MTASERPLQDQFSPGWKYCLFDICSHLKHEHGQMQSGHVERLQLLDEPSRREGRLLREQKGTRRPVSRVLYQPDKSDRR